MSQHCGCLTTGRRFLVSPKCFPDGEFQRFLRCQLLSSHTQCCNALESILVTHSLLKHLQIPCTPHSSPHKSLHHETSNAWSSTREHKWPVNPPLLPRAAPGRSVTPACCTRVECRTGPGLGRPSPASALFLPGGWLLQATPSGPSDGGYAEYLWAKATIEALHE